MIMKFSKEEVKRALEDYCDVNHGIDNLDFNSPQSCIKIADEDYQFLDLINIEIKLRTS